MEQSGDKDLLLMVVRYNQLMIRHVRAYAFPFEYLQEYVSLKEAKALGLDLVVNKVKTLVLKAFEGELLGFGEGNEVLFSTNRQSAVHPFTDMINGDLSKNRLRTLDVLTLTGIHREIQDFLSNWVGWSSGSVAVYRHEIDEIYSLTDKRKKLKPVGFMKREKFGEAVLSCGSIGMLLYAQKEEAIALLELKFPGTSFFVLIVSVVSGNERTTIFNAIPFSLSDKTSKELREKINEVTLKKLTFKQKIMGI